MFSTMMLISQLDPRDHQLVAATQATAWLDRGLLAAHSDVQVVLRGRAPSSWLGRARHSMNQRSKALFSMRPIQCKQLDEMI